MNLRYCIRVACLTNTYNLLVSVRKDSLTYLDKVFATWVLGNNSNTEMERLNYSVRHQILAEKGLLVSDAFGTLCNMGREGGAGARRRRNYVVGEWEKRAQRIYTIHTSSLKGIQWGSKEKAAICMKLLGDGIPAS